MKDLNLYRGMQKIIANMKTKGISDQEIKKRLGALGLSATILASGFAIGCDNQANTTQEEEEPKVVEEKEQEEPEIEEEEIEQEEPEIEEEKDQEEVSFYEYFNEIRDRDRSKPPGKLSGLLDPDVSSFLEEESFISYRTGSEIYWSELKEEYGILYMFAAMQHVEGELLEKLLIADLNCLVVNVPRHFDDLDSLQMTPTKVIKGMNSDEDKQFVAAYREQEFTEAITEELINNKGRKADLIGYGSYLGTNFYSVMGYPITDDDRLIKEELTENRKRILASNRLTSHNLKIEAAEKLGLEVIDLETYGPQELKVYFSDYRQYEFEDYEKVKQK